MSFLLLRWLHAARGCGIALCCLIICIQFAPLPAHAQPGQEEKKAARKEYLARSRRSGTLGNILRARAELTVYDKLMQARPADWRDQDLLFHLNELRWSILRHSLSAYFFAGNNTIPLDDAEVLGALEQYISYNDSPMAMPAALDELVDRGYLAHLPESPYPGGMWLTAPPATDPPPGSILYLSWKPGMQVFNEDPALECFLLVQFDKPDNSDVLSPEDAKGHYIGDITAVMPYFATNIIQFCGQDYNTGG